MISLAWAMLSAHFPRAREERGATAVEYGLMIALIAGVILTSVMFFGGRVVALYDVGTKGW